MLWFAIGLFVASLLAWGVPTLLTRQFPERRRRGSAWWWRSLRSRWPAASVVQVFRVGESGSKAVWTGSFCAEPVERRRVLPGGLRSGARLHRDPVPAAGPSGPLAKRSGENVSAIETNRTLASVLRRRR